jgi:hypothetical protein
MLRYPPRVARRQVVLVGVEPELLGRPLRSQLPVRLAPLPYVAVLPAAGSTGRTQSGYHGFVAPYLIKLDNRPWPHAGTAAGSPPGRFRSKCGAWSRSSRCTGRAACGPCTASRAGSGTAAAGGRRPHVNPPHLRNFMIEISAIQGATAPVAVSGGAGRGWFCRSRGRG